MAGDKSFMNNVNQCNNGPKFDPWGTTDAAKIGW